MVALVTMIDNKVLFHGHIYVSLIYIILSIWWTFNIFKEYFNSRLEYGQEVLNRPYYLGPYWQYPVESLCKIIHCANALIIVMIVSIKEDGFLSPETTCYIIIPLSIGWWGICDLLTFKRCSIIPEGSEVLSGIFSALVQCLLMYIHSLHRLDVGCDFYVFLSITKVVILVVVYLETCRRNSVMLSLTRCALVQLYGTWHLNTALFYYKPYRQYLISLGKNANQIVALTFLCHCFANILRIFVIGWCVCRRTKRSTLINNSSLL